MPVPASVTPGHGQLKIDGAFRVSVEGRDERLRKAAVRAIRLLAKETGIPFRQELAADGAGATLRVRAAAPGLPMPALEEDESYRLEVTSTGAGISAPTVIGAIRGLATFSQMLEVDGNGYFVSTVRVEDKPRFRWRGLVIDIARHWMPMEVLKRNLDGMAAVKLNVLHLHISDDQGFRIESKRYPKLHQMGSNGDYYTQDQMRELVAYARDRGIRVLPEFDIPGHTGAWFPGYPLLSSSEGPHRILTNWGVNDSCLDPTREETYRLLDGFIGEMAGLFPDAFFHIGGDEVNGVQWNANPRIVEFKTSHGMKDNHDLQAYFNKRVQAIVAEHGKIMIGWDEMLQPSLPRSIVIQSWRGPKSLAEAARGGYRSLLSSGYYLDLYEPAWQHYAVEPVSGDAASLSPSEQEKILGGEACMWSEFTTPETIDLRIWPRAAAIAERYWSPAAVNDVESMYGRMERVSRRVSLLGLTHRTNYWLMLERLAGAGRAETVKTLADVVEPVKGYARGEARKYTNTTPLNRMVDTAASESLVAREFAAQVAALLRGSGNVEAVERNLVGWRDYAKQALPLLLSSALLEETAPVAENLSAVAAYGLQALQYFRSGKPASAAWYKEASAALARAEKPHAELLLMTVAPTRRLVEAVRPAER
ncbi:MAG: beta-N-acetylhexosaminidase [Acidobacteria bacterium]|nr:beta-N-acetylhexosaminidase [Acidobacteriota bacterium]